MLNSGKGFCGTYNSNGGELEVWVRGEKNSFFCDLASVDSCTVFPLLGCLTASWNFSHKCKQEGIIYVHYRVKKKSPYPSSSCLSNILKKQNRAQAHFFFAFQVSFKSRDSHDAAILEVEASKCFTSCKHSSKFLQITCYLMRLVQKEPQPLPLS